MRHFIFSAFVLTASLCTAEEEQDFAFPQEKESAEIAAIDTTSFLQPSQRIEGLDEKPPILQENYKSPTIAASLATLFPGLGHLYLNDYATAGRFAGSSSFEMGTLIGAARAKQNQLASASAYLFTNEWYYNIYAAYRDARVHNGLLSSRYRMPTDSLAEIAYAPFSWETMKKPEVWGGILGCFGASVILANVIYRTSSKTPSCSTTTHFPILSLPVAIGEEALFRGFLQSALLEVSPPWIGIPASSLLFSAAHIGNAQQMNNPDQRKRYYKFSLPFISLCGGYFGWLTYKNHSLKESTAVHMWYDFILFSIDYAANRVIDSAENRASLTRNLNLSFSFQF